MAQMNTDLIPALRQSINIELPDNLSFESLHDKLSDHINHLIQNDFQKLALILYRIDVNEEKLKRLLEENTNKDASTIITDLIIERQLQKIKSRQEFRRDNNISEEEKW